MRLHVPVGKTISLKMWSADVVHSFWSPQLAAKRDVFPQGPRFQKINPLWFRADTTGDFSGQCAEFCGIQHARMGLRVIVQTDAEFDAWVAQQRIGSPLVNAGVVAPATDSAGTPVPVDSMMVLGAQTFQAAGCIACHAMVGTPLAGTTALQGPNLSHVGSRRSIGANMYAQHSGEPGQLAPGSPGHEGRVADGPAAAADRGRNHHAGGIPAGAPVTGIRDT